MEKTWVITDSESSFSSSDFLITGNTLGLDERAYCAKSTLHGGRQEGVEVIEISNGALRLRVCPTRGMAIIDGTYHDIHLGWKSPVKEIVHPAYLNLYDLGGRGIHYGFNEMLNRCGIEWSGAMGEDTVVDNKGQVSRVFLPLHGKIGISPASKVVLRVDDESLILEGEIRETNVFGVNYLLQTSLRLTLESSSIEIKDVLKNEGAQPNEYEMLYHTNFGPPFLEKGSRFYGSFSRVVARDEFGTIEPEDIKRFSGPHAGSVEQVYLFRARADEQGLAHQLLTNSSGELAVHVAFDPSTLPYTILWKRLSAIEDGYVAGLNPCTDLPNNRALERRQKRVAVLGPHEKVVFSHSVHIIEGREKVSELAEKIESLSDWSQVGSKGDFTFFMD